MSDSYPEHLNPFFEDVKPKKLTIRNSFKDFKRTLRQSFRIKKKDDGEVTLRKKTDTGRLASVSYQGEQSAPTLLPRSRFHERLSKQPASNPFEEDENFEDNKSTISRRKAKKRAPLPPKSISSQCVNNETSEVRVGSSHWSLTSVDTNFSGCTETNPVQDEHETKTARESIVEKFINFNKNMDTLKDDSKNTTKVEVDKYTESNNNIPDLVISCPNDDSDEKLQNDEDSSKSVLKDVTSTIMSEQSEGNNLERDETKYENQNHEEEAFLFHERKSLYIHGSTDQLDDSNTYTRSVSLYITGSCDDIDASNNNELVHKTDENSNDDTIPIPKQRKTKLTKDVLLGV